jgi:UDP-N-acetylglucosamine 1-carboxyvinyltransferase
MAAALLTDQPLQLENVPALGDIGTMASLLSQLGADIDSGSAGTPAHRMKLSVAAIKDTTAPYDLVRKMRASVLVLGPLLAREGRAKVSLPGGCAIGTRPIDLHLKGLSQMGDAIELVDGYVAASAPNGLSGARIVFPNVSVGATENLLMAASLGRGETVLVNAAREPEIADLAHCLVAMGAKIDGIGTDTLTVQGVDRLHAAVHTVIADRIETGTFAMAAAVTDGDVELVGGQIDHIGAVAESLTRAGVEITPTPAGFRARRANGELAGVDVMTEPFPGFPTDLQAQFMALMTSATGAAMVTETIFENRFMHVPELCRMGANINVHGASAMIRGVKRLTGAPVMATDLRASVSLVIAGLAAEGQTVLSRIYHLDRGYERLVDKLAACGAQIERLKE